MSHPVENIMRSTMEQLRQMVDVNTIVGSPVETGSGTVLLPVSKVSMGFVSGGGEYIMGQAATPVKRAGDALDASEGRYPFAGTAAAGMCLRRSLQAKTGARACCRRSINAARKG